MPVLRHEPALAIFEGQNDRSGIAETLDLPGATSFLCADASGYATYCERAVTPFEELNEHQLLSSSVRERLLENNLKIHYIRPK